MEVVCLPMQGIYSFSTMDGGVSVDGDNAMYIPRAISMIVLSTYFKTLMVWQAGMFHQS